MKALYITGGIIAFLLLLSLVKVTVKLSFVNDLQVRLKILFISIKIYPLKAAEPKKAAPAKKKPPAPAKPRPEKKTPPIKDILHLVKELVAESYSKFRHYIRLEEYRVKVLVATDDPAKTGVLYGAVCAALGALSVVTDRIKRRSKKKGRFYTEVTPDFIAEQPELFLSVALSLRIWQLASMGATAAKGLLKYNSLSKGVNKDDQPRDAA